MGALGLDAVDWAGVSGRYSSFTDAKHNVVQGGCHLALPVGRKRGVSRHVRSVMRCLMRPPSNGNL